MCVMPGTVPSMLAVGRTLSCSWVRTGGYGGSLLLPEDLFAVRYSCPWLPTPPTPSPALVSLFSSPGRSSELFSLQGHSFLVALVAHLAHVILDPGVVILPTPAGIHCPDPRTTCHYTLPTGPVPDMVSTPLGRRVPAQGGGADIPD